MIIGVDKGHPVTGVGTGAVGYVKETDKNREIGNRFIAMLKEKGHTVVDCTVDKSNNDLADRVAKANRQYLDVFISLHLNSYSEEKANGVETFSLATAGTGDRYAKAIQSELLKSINWANRGKKEANFYVLRNTNAPAVLVELGFVTNKSDMDKWDNEKIARALFKGITGQEYVSNINNNVNTAKYIVTNYLPHGYKGQGSKEEGLDLEYILSYFGGVRCYLKSDSQGQWIETQYLDSIKLEELKKSLGSWVYSVK